tara:strand:- start:390 stop:707 length:318 start_codon:yes stop_codon:yes gene_type:complete
MNMDVSNKEIEKLLKEYLKRLDRMDKDRDQMIKKLKALSKAVKDINVDLDELFKVMDGGKITINLDDFPMEDDEVKEMSILIDTVKDDFEKDEYLSLIHSVVGEA